LKGLFLDENMLTDAGIKHLIKAKWISL
jgi:hypothetical protein